MGKGGEFRRGTWPTSGGERGVGEKAAARQVAAVADWKKIRTRKKMNGEAVPRNILMLR